MAQDRLGQPLSNRSIAIVGADLHVRPEDKLPTNISGSMPGSNDRCAVRLVCPCQKDLPPLVMACVTQKTLSYFLDLHAGHNFIVSDFPISELKEPTK